MYGLEGSALSGSQSELRIICDLILFFAACPNPPRDIAVENDVNLQEPASVTITWNPSNNLDSFDLDCYEINGLPERVCNSSVTRITINGVPSGSYSVNVVAISRCGASRRCGTSGQSRSITVSVGKFLNAPCMWYGMKS